MADLLSSRHLFVRVSNVAFDLRFPTLLAVLAERAYHMAVERGLD
jgi:hypothetical protein